MIDTLISWLGGEAKTVAFAILGGVFGFLGKIIYDLWMARRKDKLERVNKQLRLLYGPLFSLVSASTTTWRAFKDKYCENPDFRTEFGYKPQTPAAEAIWRHWMKNVFMPLNSQMAKIIIENADLLEEKQIPPCLLELSAHVHGYKGILAAWDKEDHSEHMSLISFPGSVLDSYLKASYNKLKIRQARLIGSIR